MRKINRSSKKKIASPDYYRRLFAYNRKVFNAYLNALAKLPWKTLSKNMESSHYSMKDTLVHILTVYNGWLNYNVYGRSSEIPHETEHNPESYNSIGDIRKFRDKVWLGVDELLDNLDDELLAKKVKAPWLPGSHYLADVLMQVSFEQAHHIGEIIAMMWQLDIEPPEMTWIMNTRNMR
ncbi:MAG: DinB family protein [archaeon]|nr:DinB family protein [archaeon]